VVHHEAQVGLVDAHAEGPRREHARRRGGRVVRPAEAVVHAGALLAREVAVVDEQAFAAAALLGSQPPVQEVLEPEQVADQRAVDDAGAAQLREARREQLPLRRLVLDDGDGEEEVRAREPGVVEQRVGQAQLRADLGDHGGRRGRGERDGRRVAEAAPDLPDPPVLGPEVVAPGRDAVRLVDGEQGEAARGGALGGDRRDEGGVAEALGRDVEQAQLAAREGGGAPLPVGALDVRVDAGGGDPPRAQRGDLVLHQRDQRREDEDRPLLRQRRQLVDERLAAAGRPDDERVAAREQVVDHGALPAAEGGEAEAFAQQLRQSVVHRGRYRASEAARAPARVARPASAAERAMPP
jgi:hypothetical protein